MAGEFREDADEPPLASLADMPLPLSITAKDATREEDGLRDWISAGEASKIVKPFVLKPGGKIARGRGGAELSGGNAYNSVMFSEAADNADAELERLSLLIMAPLENDSPLVCAEM